MGYCLGHHLDTGIDLENCGNDADSGVLRQAYTFYPYIGKHLLSSSLMAGSANLSPATLNSPGILCYTTNLKVKDFRSGPSSLRLHHPRVTGSNGRV